MADMTDLIPTSEAARIANVSTQYIRQMVYEKRLTAVKVGFAVFVKRESLAAYMREVKQWKDDRAKALKANKAKREKATKAK